MILLTPRVLASPQFFIIEREYSEGSETIYFNTRCPELLLKHVSLKPAVDLHRLTPSRLQMTAQEFEEFMEGFHAISRKRALTPFWVFQNVLSVLCLYIPDLFFDFGNRKVC